MKKLLSLILFSILSISFYSCDDKEDIKPLVEDKLLKVSNIITLKRTAPVGQFFSTLNFGVYDYETTKKYNWDYGLISNIIDFGYFYSSSSYHCLASPSSSIYYNYIKNKRETIFKYTIQSTDNLSYFNNINKNSQLDSSFINPPIILNGFIDYSGEVIRNLKSGQIILLETSNNKKSIIYIDSVNHTNNSDNTFIKFKIKTQE
jgi:hypothetical protein